MNYYNEFDPKAATWLRELIKAGLIPNGDVDERSIVDVKAGDLAGYTQCHFFAGIGGWSYALRLSGWPEDRPVWTGSCPCQPFSNAGKGLGEKDMRHLWPELRRLISEFHPSVVYGEQVASAAGRSWLSSVRTDLEELGYGVGAADLCAAGVGAPHIRQRLYFGACRMADNNKRLERRRKSEGKRTPELSIGKGSMASGVAHHDGSGLQSRQRDDTAPGHGDTSSATSSYDRNLTASSTDVIWRDPDWLFCRDGKWRPVESGTFPLAHGASSRVGRLRGYGNAIVPQVASEFIKAFEESRRLYE